MGRIATDQDVGGGTHMDRRSFASRRHLTKKRLGSFAYGHMPITFARKSRFSPMPRPICPRRIAHHPPCDYFKPAGVPLYELEEVVLAADELEALRLADVEDLFHTVASVRMRVSRQTFDRIVRRARMKIARALVLGHALRIIKPAAPAVPARKTSARPSRRC
jgi:uncharacterized protein